MGTDLQPLVKCRDAIASKNEENDIQNSIIFSQQGKKLVEHYLIR